MSKPAENLMDRFFRHANPTNDDSCWVWTGTINSSGYGYLTVIPPGKRARNIGAHRFSWELHNAEQIPVGLFVIHSCDRPECVSPRHIRLGTPAENTQDMISRGRGKYIAHPGERNPNARLTDDAVRVIKSLRGAATANEIAKEYGVKPSTIAMILCGKNWRHISPLATLNDDRAALAKARGE